jgi:hypothetical protein
MDGVMYSYYPKSNLVGEVKKLGYYLDSISTSDFARQYSPNTVSTSRALSLSRIQQLLRVGLKVDPIEGLQISVREYLLAMGRGIMLKVKDAKELVLE